MSEWTDNFIFAFVKRLGDWAEHDPADFATQSLLYLLPFMMVATLLTLKLNAMIAGLHLEKMHLEKIKKISKKE